MTVSFSLTAEKQPACPSLYEWIKKKKGVVHLYGGILLSHNKGMKPLHSLPELGMLQEGGDSPSRVRE